MSNQNQPVTPNHQSRNTMFQQGSYYPGYLQQGISAAHPDQLANHPGVAAAVDVYHGTTSLPPVSQLLPINTTKNNSMHMMSAAPKPAVYPTMTTSINTNNSSNNPAAATGHVMTPTPQQPPTVPSHPPNQKVPMFYRSGTGSTVTSPTTTSLPPTLNAMPAQNDPYYTLPSHHHPSMHPPTTPPNPNPSILPPSSNDSVASLVYSNSSSFIPPQQPRLYQPQHQHLSSPPTTLDFHPHQAVAGPSTPTPTVVSNVPPQHHSHQPPAQKVFSFVSLPGNNQKKRPRRKYDEVDRLYHCNFLGCSKSYGTLNHLNAHICMQNHGPKRHPSEFKELRKMWRKQKKEHASQSKKSPMSIASNEDTMAIPPPPLTLPPTAPPPSMLHQPLPPPPPVPVNFSHSDQPWMSSTLPAALSEQSVSDFSPAMNYPRFHS
ncbi:hypothetical protein DM01DRAFT_1382122 [Hesseltinella vesiculosa]|uniref:C2H2-type domain-containing protein n=1 Tax=Hesseltinella vesiculosa TaxID=101127 RepID=A0A1X2GNA0_9FUNG|nr:hypothetical protein DM01DRAFT_1382122 [Hesseltinella vesiculosa]